jgi:hypothetical protein
MVAAMISKIVDNVQIHVKNIHLRYEDGTSTPEVSDKQSACTAGFHLWG